MRHATLPCLAVFVSLLSTVRAQGEDPVTRLENSPRHHEWVNIKTDAGRTVRTFVAFPEAPGPTAALVVIHENRGLNVWARSFADQMAEAGYLAIAPDLLSGTGPDGGGTEAFGSADAARNGIYKLPDEQVGADLDAVIAFAQKHPAGTGVVAAAGFCWGGGKSFAHAATNSGVSAACVFYGTAPQDDATYQAISAPVYGFYGGNDHRITGAVPEVKKKMETLGKKYDPVAYEGAGHAYMRAGESASEGDPNYEARAKSLVRLKGILSELTKEKQ
ncbi:Carboxymethylenebutenolidase [Posidoniimonas polymericola]|uniref:Carboxymethylenebutenolidase n=1 Tax=Posidoniimonas polymericola TaxID=2528002 RepID=A0A5C5YDZ2_9BACT|nr:dienelactone hydrolase family protein [Posidoniimonas polymericola]TWT73570.1 Carboxymethylenebutenolidase [Posidoniimonas polymericola]